MTIRINRFYKSLHLDKGASVIIHMPSGKVRLSFVPPVCGRTVP